jgi:serine/threonine protein phosphatase PrpC
MDSLLTSGHTDPGRRRKENQDAFIIRQLWSADKYLLSVIDGVGGYAGGEKAAAIARDCMEQYMQSPSGDTLTMLREAVVFANNRIVEERKNDQHISEMCCVLTAVVADAAAQCVYFAHVGDTRLYRFRDGNLQKLTRDHSFVGIKEDAGEMSELEAMRHPQRNQIFREVGSAPHRLDDEDFMDYGRESLLAGDVLLLCSDGLTDMITAQQIIALLSTDRSLDDKVSSLVKLANDMGGHDNITVVLLQQEATDVPSVITTDIPVAVKETQLVPQTVATKKNIQRGKRTLLWGFLLLLLIAGAGWYFAPPNNQTSSPVDVLNTQPGDSVSPPPGDLGAGGGGRSSHTAVPGPVAAATADTLQVSATQNFTAIKHYTDSTGRVLVLVPTKNSALHFAAIAITAGSAQTGDTLLLRNLRLIGFDTGVSVRVPVLIQTTNLVFENIKYPFRYLVKAGQQQPSLLFMNTEKQ